jgi:hypothetical protein
MLRNNDPIRVKIKTAIPFVIYGISKENTKGGARRKFMWSCG